MIMKSHNDLKVYQEAMDLVTEVYEITNNFPDSEKLGLVSQIRRCAVSIPSNIAEGAARESKKEFKRFLLSV
jgi:four helix bundle protein